MKQPLFQPVFTKVRRVKLMRDVMLTVNTDPGRGREAVLAADVGNLHGALDIVKAGTLLKCASPDIRAVAALGQRISARDIGAGVRQRTGKGASDNGKGEAELEHDRED